jgi:hypothetical protein
MHKLHLQKDWQLGIVLHSKKLDSEAAGGAPGQEPPRELAFCLRTPALFQAFFRYVASSIGNFIDFCT